MARMHILQAIHTGKATYLLLSVLAIMFVVDYNSSQSLAFAVLKISHPTDEISHLSNIKRGKALSYIENPYQKQTDP